MIDVTLLGTGGMLPLPNRYLTSLMVRHNGGYVLLDCGEGTQMAVRAAGLSFSRINTICITHFHADHTAGLPGMLLTIGNSERREPITMIGPIGLKKVVESLRVIAPILPYEIRYEEISGENNSFSSGELQIDTTLVDHDMVCYAYAISLSRSGKFSVDKAKALGIPVKLWSKLQKEEEASWDDQTVAPEQVLGLPRMGIKLCYATDLRPSQNLVKLAENADLFICEGNYGDPEKLHKALEYKHCLFREAAAMAKEASVGELWLTHFSPSMPNPQEYIEEATDIFPNTFIDKTKTTLQFVD